LTELLRITGEKLIICPHLLLQELLQQNDLPAQQTFFQTSSFTPRLTDLDTRLLSLRNASLGIALCFKTCIVFQQLIWCSCNHFQHSGSFREFPIGKQLGKLLAGQLFSVAKKPAPAFDG